MSSQDFGMDAAGRSMRVIWNGDNWEDQATTLNRGKEASMRIMRLPVLMFVALLILTSCGSATSTTPPHALLGSIIEFRLPTVPSQPSGIVKGPDGNLWFTESGGNKIGRISPNGTITEYAVPTARSMPTAIADGPDGNLWFTEQNGYKIGRINTSGIITEYALPTAKSHPSGITTGPDGNLWFTEAALGLNGEDKIGRLT